MLGQSLKLITTLTEGFDGMSMVESKPKISFSLLETLSKKLINSALSVLAMKSKKQQLIFARSCSSNPRIMQTCGDSAFMLPLLSKTKTPTGIKSNIAALLLYSSRESSESRFCIFVFLKERAECHESQIAAV